MASPRRSAPTLLVLLILLLCWMTSAWSLDPPSDNSAPYRVKRDLPFRTREEVAAATQVVKDSLTVIKEVFGKIDPQKVGAVMKGISSIASLAPGIGGLVASFITVVLAFIPQENPLKELREGFAEVNRKLDSLSIKLSNLATDVEWFNYASVYSQDEIRILNAWKKFNEFRENSELVQSEDAKLRLAEIFTNYYENTAAEASVANFYHYLTVNTTSLGGNLNDLLIKKFKCGITEIGRYNIYFSSLLLKGMVLNQFYWNLIGFNSSGKEAEQAQMFSDVYAAQSSAVDFCKSNYERYMKDYVVELAKEKNPEHKLTIASLVKQALEKKYNWYNWVVVVYDTDQDKNHIFYTMEKVVVGKITVAVGYTQKGEEESREQVSKELDSCYEKVFDYVRGISGYHKTEVTPCENIAQEIPQCSRLVGGHPVKDFVKVTHTSYPDSIHVPKALQTFRCKWDGYYSKIFVYYSPTSSTVCHHDTCHNGGQCKRLWDTNEYLCDCPKGFYGEKCEKKINTSIPTRDLGYAVPDITTINAKLEEILCILRNPHRIPTISC